MSSPRQATPDHPIQPLVSQRWSPYAFADRPVHDDDLRSLFEAARWAASSYNEQPWRYIFATKSNRTQFERLLSCLVEGNQIWARAAPVLALGCISLNFARNGQPNAAAQHDLGLASATLTLEATARGLVVHQMIGIVPDKARELYRIPAGFLPLTGLAIGYVADPATLPDNLRGRDLAPRTRRPLAEFVFGGEWGTASGLAEHGARTTSGGQATEREAIYRPCAYRDQCDPPGDEGPSRRRPLHGMQGHVGSQEADQTLQHQKPAEGGQNRSGP